MDKYKEAAREYANKLGMEFVGETHHALWLELHADAFRWYEERNKKTCETCGTSLCCSTISAIKTACSAVPGFYIPRRVFLSFFQKPSKPFLFWILRRHKTHIEKFNVVRSFLKGSRKHLFRALALAAIASFALSNMAERNRGRQIPAKRVSNSEKKRRRKMVKLSRRRNRRK